MAEEKQNELVYFLKKEVGGGFANTVVAWDASGSMASQTMHALRLVEKIGEKNALHYVFGHQSYARGYPAYGEGDPRNKGGSLPLIEIQNIYVNKRLLDSATSLETLPFSFAHANRTYQSNVTLIIFGDGANNDQLNIRDLRTKAFFRTLTRIVLVYPDGISQYLIQAMQTYMTGAVAACEQVITVQSMFVSQYSRNDVQYESTPAGMTRIGTLAVNNVQDIADCYNMQPELRPQLFASLNDALLSMKVIAGSANQRILVENENWWQLYLVLLKLSKDNVYMKILTDINAILDSSVAGKDIHTRLSTRAREIGTREAQEQFAKQIKKLQDHNEPVQIFCSAGKVDCPKHDSLFRDGSKIYDVYFAGLGEWTALGALGAPNSIRLVYYPLEALRRHNIDLWDFTCFQFRNFRPDMPNGCYLTEPFYVMMVALWLIKNSEMPEDMLAWLSAMVRTPNAYYSSILERDANDKITFHRFAPEPENITLVEYWLRFHAPEDVKNAPSVVRYLTNADRIRHYKSLVRFLDRSYEYAMQDPAAGLMGTWCVLQPFMDDPNRHEPNFVQYAEKDGERGYYYMNDSYSNCGRFIVASKLGQKPVLRHLGSLSGESYRHELLGRLRECRENRSDFSLEENIAFLTEGIPFDVNGRSDVTVRVTVDQMLKIIDPLHPLVQNIHDPSKMWQFDNKENMTNLHDIPDELCEIIRMDYAEYKNVREEHIDDQKEEFRECNLCMDMNPSKSFLNPVMGYCQCFCKPCQRGIIRSNFQKGKHVSVSSLKCRVCRLSPPLAENGIKFTEKDFPDPTKNYMWCVDCDTIKEYGAHACADAAQAMEAPPRCAPCEEKRNPQSKIVKCPNPKCNAETVRIDGCNHMTCICKTHYCWLCRFSANNADAIYAHLRDECGGTFGDNGRRRK